MSEVPTPTDQKPIVSFSGPARFMVAPYPDPATGKEWTFARVYALNHPHLGCDIVRTSEVIKQNDDGSFETRNTRYVPASHIDADEDTLGIQE